MAFLFPRVGSVIENKAQRAHTCRLLATNVLAPHCIWNLIFWLFFAFCFIKNVSEQGIQSYTSDTKRNSFTKIFHSQSTKQNFETAKFFSQMGRCFACKDLWYTMISLTENCKSTARWTQSSDTCNNISNVIYWWERRSSHIWHNRSDRLSAAFALWGVK